MKPVTPEELHPALRAWVLTQLEAIKSHTRSAANADGVRWPLVADSYIDAAAVIILEMGVAITAGLLAASVPPVLVVEHLLHQHESKGQQEKCKANIDLRIREVVNLVTQVVANRP